MIISIQINNRICKIETDEQLDISIPLNFNGAQPNAYGVERASSTPCQAGSLVGDTRQGGSCNFEEYRFIPHCNGTHTECIGHITDERISVHESLRDAFIPSTLITVEPVKASDTADTYTPDKNAEDRIITKDSLQNALKDFDKDWLAGLIVRTLPNDESKKTRAYMENIPPFFSLEAMRFIVESGVKHLLVDMPSIDRTFDEGKLSNHRIFWNVEPESREASETSLINNTVTEMIFVPNSVKDGTYLLNLQIAPFVADASPCRPILFKVIA